MPTTTKLGTWIYERTTPTGGSGSTSIPAAPPVTIDEVHISIDEKENGLIEVSIPWVKSPEATDANFLGVKLYIEDPDNSEKAAPAMDGTVKLGGQASLSGGFTAIFKNDYFKSPAVFVIPGKPEWRPVRFYLASFGPSKMVKLVPANAAPPAVPTPNTRQGIGAAQGSYVSGMEHTWLVTDQDVIPDPDFDGAAGPQYRLFFDFKPPEATSGKGNTAASTSILTRTDTDPKTVFTIDMEGKAVLVDGKAYKVREVVDQSHLKLDTEPPDATNVDWTVLYGTPLPRTPGLKPFAGVQIVYEKADGTRTQGQFLDVNKPEEWVSPYFPIGETQTFKVYFVSRDIEGHLNEIKSVTPFKTVQIVYPPTGQGPTPDVTGFSITNKTHEWELDYTLFAVADFAWTPPDSARYSGVSIYRVGVDPPRLIGTFPASIKKTTVKINDLPDPAQTWTFAAIAYNFDGKPTADPAQYPWTGKPEATRVPTATWVVGKPADGGLGIEYAPLVTKAGTVTTEQILNADGVVMMRHVITGWTEPTGDNRFGGVSIARLAVGVSADTKYTYWDIPKGVTDFTTPWEPAPSARTYRFYFLSRSGEGKRNSVSPSTLYTVHDFVPIKGDIVPSRLPSGWWNEDEFSWPAQNDPNVDFSVKQIVAPKIYVGSILRVGGGSTGTLKGLENGQIAVYNSSNKIRAWMGQQDSTLPGGGTATVYGGWFYELYIGGDDPSTAPIYTNNAGTVIVGGWDVKGTRYPYISIRNEANLEVARIGARLSVAQSPPVGGDAAAIAGGWFKELAIGGQSMNDWRVLCKRAATSDTQEQDLIRFRNISKFTIDYAQNFQPPGTTNVNNEPITLAFGFDAYVADSTDSRYWKIPGLKFARTDQPTNGMVLIHRGIVITGPSNLRKASLVSWNGNQFSDPTNPSSVWWGELALYSPLTDPSKSGTVLLRGGSAADEALPGWAAGSVSGNAGCPVFRMMDEAASVNFSVDQRGNVYIRRNAKIDGALTVGSMSLASLTVTGQIQGGTLLVQAGATYGAIDAGSLNLHTGSISNVASITASGTISATGGFSGPYSGNVTGNLTGSVIGQTTNTVTAGGAITGGSFSTGSVNVIDSTGKYIGHGVDVTTSYDIKGRGIYGELYYHKGNEIINTNGAFLGAGVSCKNDGIQGNAFNVWVQAENKNYPGIKVRMVGADGYAYYFLGGLCVDTTNPNKGTWN